MKVRLNAWGIAVSTLSAVLLTACGASTEASTTSPEAPASSSTASTMPSESASEATTPTATASKAPAAQPAVITIKDFAYQQPASVAPGAEVTVVNMDSQNHTVTAKNKEFDAAATARGGKSTFTAPTKPGRYPFICTLHPNMTGVLVVK